MEQSPSSEADNTLASQEIHPAIMETKSSSLCSQDPATSPYPESDESNSHPPTLFL
jgi:hypothetical protein